MPFSNVQSINFLYTSKFTPDTQGKKDVYLFLLILVFAENEKNRKEI